MSSSCSGRMIVRCTTRQPGSTGGRRSSEVSSELAAVFSAAVSVTRSSSARGFGALYGNAHASGTANPTPRRDRSDCPYDDHVPGPPATVYVHIGPPKTGTTYLQDVLWRNQRSLAGRGVVV